MLISTSNNKSPIKFTAETITDGFQLGMITAKLDKLKISYDIEINKDIQSIIIQPKDLIKLLC